MMHIFQKEAAFPLISDVIIEGLDVGIVESYFLARNFYRFSEEISADLAKLKSLTYHTLEKEDNDLFK